MKKTKAILTLSMVCSISAGCSNITPVSDKILSEKIVKITTEQSEATAVASVPLGSFKGALKTVSSSHPQVKTAQAQAKRAAQAVNERTAGLKPQAGITARAGQYNDSNGWSQAAALGVDVTQLIYDGGATRSGMDAAQAARVKADYSVTATRNEILHSSISAWIDVWSLKQRIAQMNLRLDEAQPLINRIKKMAQTGLADRTIIEKADKSLLDVQLERQRLETSLSEATGKFENYFGRVPGNLPSPTNLASKAELDLALKQWKASPQVAMQAVEVVIAEYELSIAEADLKPQVMASVGSTAPMSSDEPVQSVGVMVKYTFGDGGRRKSRVAGAKERLQAAKSDLENVLNQNESAALAAKLTYADIDAGIALVEEQIVVLKQSRDTARSQIASAQSNLNTLLETEIDLYRAEDRLLSMRAEKMKIESRILQLGGVLEKHISR